MDTPQTCASDPPCALCCKILGVPELDKGRMEWCKHANIGKKKSPSCAGGCTIYDTRPASCREFSCIWRLSQDESDPTRHLPKHMKPSVCGAVMHQSRDGQSLVFDMNEGVRWRNNPALVQFIFSVSMGVRVIVREGMRMTIIARQQELATFLDPRDRREHDLPLEVSQIQESAV